MCHSSDYDFRSPQGVNPPPSRLEALVPAPVGRQGAGSSSIEDDLEVILDLGNRMQTYNEPCRCLQDDMAYQPGEVGGPYAPSYPEGFYCHTHDVFHHMEEMAPVWDLEGNDRR